MSVVDMTVELVGTITVSPAGDDDDVVVEQHLDMVMDELCTLGAVDPDIALDLGDYTVTLTATINAPNPVAAVQEASTLFRTAIHAAGGATPDWPDAFAEAWAIRLTSVQAVVEPDRELVDA